ncbi:MAG: HD domain-containing protein [Bacteroidales bacterium]|nr:HD domain-containing protein [Bacteroidales bacterium]
MNNETIINNTIAFVKEKLDGESSGHDWWHIYRVWNLAKKLQNQIGGNIFIIELAALLHDIADWKLHESEEQGMIIVETWLLSQNIDENSLNHILSIIKKVSFKGAGVKDNMNTIEGKIIQDADRLDAIGAIGIARTFAFGGKFGNEMFNPNIKVKLHNSFSEYKKSKGTTINHFYEKLLLLKDRMNTQEAKQIAYERHIFMETFLSEFMDEWNAIK